MNAQLDTGLVKQACLIDGRWQGDATVAVLNPATGETLAHVPSFGAAETEMAVEAAARAFKSWKTSLAKERAALLRRWFELVRENRESLARILTSEQGKPLAEALGEIDYAASYIEFFGEEAKRIAGETLPNHVSSARTMVVRQPAGVVAAITPWNFPAAMITRKVAPAIAAGCTVVVKPAMETPLTALALAELAQKAGFPPGLLNVVTGKSREIGGVMTSHEAVRVVSFTGSTEVGKLLIRACADTVKKPIMELGGNAPFLVFDDADVDAAVEGALLAKFRNMGQTCVCANRLYVQSGIHDAFVDRLRGRVEAMKVGNGLSKGVVQGALINEAAIEKVDAHIADAIAHGARVVSGGVRLDGPGTFFMPTILADVSTDALVAREETFGPLAPIFKFDTEQEGIDLANATEFGLAGYFYARDIGRIYRVMEGLECGIVGVNSAAVSSELAPFGGIKQSGNAREGSHHGIDEYLEYKYVLMGGLDS